MPISLSTIKSKFIVRVRSLDNAFDRHVIVPVAVHRIDRFALQDGLISGLWQAWSWFCREIIIQSVKGAYTQQGALTASAYSAYQEMEIAYIAKQISTSQNVGTIRSLSGMYQEPTWGDVRKLNLMSLGLTSTNSQTLTTAFAACGAIMDLQLCRNANAHLNGDTVRSVKAAQVRYSDTHFQHPSDMMTWTHPYTQNYLWKAWIDEVNLVSDLAIQ